MAVQLNGVAARMFTKLAPIIAGQNFELVWVEHVGTSLRLYVDHLRKNNQTNEGAAGVTTQDAPPTIGVDDCARVSRLVSDFMDVEGMTEWVSGKFNLEVSSPGLDRPLTKRSHFEFFVGRDIKIKAEAGFISSEPMRGKCTGTLLGVSPGSIAINLDGASYDVALSKIELARLVPEF